MNIVTTTVGIMQNIKDKFINTAIKFDKSLHLQGINE
ncbi:hypothetical protein B6N60_01472 [Richelia sinica FACHB-800]|uniref:Uncharacterized protein n=1 Tax=Richelia sinica FACHB-800 TaxID=1357546 RepID=A0A975Y441_9NOST|nr:hypothetical protein B6N60_01472 [Richelia sinica FACHB-800]